MYGTAKNTWELPPTTAGKSKERAAQSPLSRHLWLGVAVGWPVPEGLVIAGGRMAAAAVAAADPAGARLALEFPGGGSSLARRPLALCPDSGVVAAPPPPP